MENLLELSKFLKEKAYKMRSDALFYELEYYFLEKKTYIIYTNSMERGMGKSYNLIKLALKYDLPIMVGSSFSKRYLTYLGKTKFDKIPNIFVFRQVEDVLGIENKPFLLEEGVSENVIRYMRNKEFLLIGFEIWDI